MKKLLFILFVLFTINLSAQEQPIEPVRIDSIQIYRPLPEKDLIETVILIPYFEKALNRLSKKYKSDQFVIKVYYSDGVSQTTILTKRKNK